MRIALTNLIPAEVSKNHMGTLLPCGFVAEPGSGVATGRPTGSSPYLGETGMEMQFLDGASGKILAACRDTRIGRKYAADLDSGVAGAAKRFAELRGVAPAAVGEYSQGYPKGRPRAAFASQDTEIYGCRLPMRDPVARTHKAGLQCRKGSGVLI